MIEDNKYEMFEEQIARLRNTKRPADELLKDMKNRSKQKKVVVDTFHITKFHRDFKAWSHQDRQEFIENDVTSYNRKLTMMSRTNYELEKSLKEIESKQKEVVLPNIKLSRSTISEYDETLLDSIDGDNSEVSIRDIFSMTGEGQKPQITFEIFQKLINIEHKLKVERMIRYDILRKIHRELTATNQKWTQRNNYLNSFIGGKLADVIKEVESIRQDEREAQEEEEEEEEEEEIDEIEREALVEDIEEEVVEGLEGGLEDEEREEVIQEDEEMKDNEIKDEEIKDEEIKDEEIKDEEIKDEEIKDEEMEENEIKDEDIKDEDMKNEDEEIIDREERP